ncbi:MAG: hypothetical protein LBQ31_07605 [Bacteroidales bacterium]|nr:hypothetical protein [Bacteroidales bacterium]
MNNLSSVSLTSLTSAGSRSVSLAPCSECGVLCLKRSREQGAGSREQGVS